MGWLAGPVDGWLGSLVWTIRPIPRGRTRREARQQQEQQHRDRLMRKITTTVFSEDGDI